MRNTDTQATDFHAGTTSDPEQGLINDGVIIGDRAFCWCDQPGRFFGFKRSGRCEFRCLNGHWFEVEC